MAETVYFEHGDVKVTEARFIASGQTFAMKNITSIKTKSKDPNRILPMIGLVVGAGFLFGAIGPAVGVGKIENFNNFFLGLAIGATLIWFCIRWLRKLKPMLTIVLTTAGSEQAALQTQQPEYLRQVVEALNQAIAHK
jgi:Family of unknown function (DUF6232)